MSVGERAPQCICGHKARGERGWFDGAMLTHTYTHTHTQHGADGLGCGEKKELQDKNEEGMERKASNSH